MQISNTRQPAFTLDPRLGADCVEIGDLRLSRLLLMDDAQYPWLILVPRRAGITEIYQLKHNDQQQLLAESSALAEAMARYYQPAKMNVANLGNIVSQLHLHHIARFNDDPAWPGPVWGQHPALPYTDAQQQQTRRDIDELLKTMPMTVNPIQI